MMSFKACEITTANSGCQREPSTGWGALRSEGEDMKVTWGVLEGHRGWHRGVSHRLGTLLRGWRSLWVALRQPCPSV